MKKNKILNKILVMILVLVFGAVFILGFLAGTFNTLPPSGGRCLPPPGSLVAISPKNNEDINYFAECLELVKNSDSFQKELWSKQWMNNK